MSEKFNRRDMLTGAVGGALFAGGLAAGKEAVGAKDERFYAKDYDAEKYALGFNTLYTVVGHIEFENKMWALLEFHNGLKMRSSLRELVHMDKGTKFILQDKGQGGTVQGSLLILDQAPPPLQKET